MTSQDPHTPAEAQVPSQESLGNHQNNKDNEDTGSLSIASSDSRKVSREDIELVQNLIERCLQLYMSKGEVVRTLSNRARIEPGFTTLVWQKLEEENADFFRAYYIRLKLKKQIILFNHLLEHQYHLMKYPMPPKLPLAPIQNGMHHLPVNNLPMGYPVMPQPQITATGQPHLDSMGLSNCHVVNGIPAQSSFHPMPMNSGNDIVMDNGTREVGPTIPSSALPTMPEMAVSPASVVSTTNHFPFPSEIPDMGMDASALDATFTSDVADGGIGRDSVSSLGQIWNFSLTDLTADLGDLGALGEYTGSPFLPSDSDILLNSPEQDDLVEEYFADAINATPLSDEEKT